MINTYNVDNMAFNNDTTSDLVYCDMIYENKNLEWIDKYWDTLKDNGVFIVQTDYHSSAEVCIHLKSMKNSYFLNWLIWKNEFGNFKKDRFRQAHDDILIFCKGKNWKWDSSKIQVPKATAKSKGLNPSGRQTKLATSVITDITLTTVAKERVKKADGHLIRWQKPLKLYDRIIAPFVDPGDTILDLFMGSGSLGVWSLLNNMNYIGIENDKEVFELALKNIESRR